jgi:hypothetical protein
MPNYDILICDDIRFTHRNSRKGNAMAAQLNVVAYREGWDVIYEGARYAESHHPTREDAVMAGNAQARRDGVTCVTFDRDGRECDRAEYPRAPVVAMSA